MYDRWIRTNRAGSSDASTAASVWSFRYCRAAGLERDVVVLRLDVVDVSDRQHVDVGAVADQHALGRARAGSRVAHERLDGCRLAAPAAARARARSPPRTAPALNGFSR